MIATATKRLAILLRLRRQREDVAAQDFARARARVEAILAGVSRLEESLAEHNRAVRDVLAAPPTVAPSSVAPSSTLGGAACNRTFARYRTAAIEITAALVHERARLDEAQTAMAHCRDELIAAMKQRKAMGHFAQREHGRQERIRDHAAVKEWDDLHATHAARAEETYA